jgi:hypothetical protein
MDNIKMDLRETGWSGMDWINLSEDKNQRRALVNSNEPLGTIKCEEIWNSCLTGGFTRRAHLHGVSSCEWDVDEWPCIEVGETLPFDGYTASCFSRSSQTNEGYDPFQKRPLPANFVFFSV